MSSEGSRTRAGVGVYTGLFFTTLSTLMYEILLTRIFSVTMWYHFAFVAVSIALFGLTLGALIVHLMPSRFGEEQVRIRLAQAALLFSVTIVGSFVAHLWLPFDPEWSLGSTGMVALTYVVIAVPFVFSGIAVSLSLTKFPMQVSRLYAVDLVGAGLGTVTLIWLLDVLGDGPSAVIAIASLAAVGACCYAAGLVDRRVLALAGIAVIVLATFAVGNAVSVQNQHPILRVRYAKGESEGVPLYEKWNAFSRIRVNGDQQYLDPEYIASENGGGVPRIHQFSITIDAAAGTTLTAFDGDKRLLDGRFRDKVVNAAHFARPDSNVLIVGSGGGWDVLAALAFDQPSITAVEMNGETLHVLNERYGDFTGHLDQRPGVRFVNDEARSFIARSDDRYDIIHIPMTDTWAATAAGAFALSENSLYTVEAWRTFYDHLTPGGLMSVTRWYYVPQPVEAYRLTTLAAKALREEGIANPRDHIMLIRGPLQYPDVAVVTILVSREPFTAVDGAGMRAVAREQGWEVPLAPGSGGSDPTFVEIADADDGSSIDLGFPADISPPTDDRPFFFQMVGFSDVFNPDLYGGFNDYLARSVLVLVTLTIVVVSLALLCIVVPLLLTTKRAALTGTLPLLVFFCGIGLGFLLLEISQMQRLVIFLGHPTYALSVVLFSLLIFSGIGSLATERLALSGSTAWRSLMVIAPLALLLVVLVAFGFLTPAAIDRFEASGTSMRIATATLLLAPLGLLMGMPFPIGMKVAALKPDSPTAFFWGVNGATSVCASVLAVVIAMGWGISSAYWAGFLSYAVAAAAITFVVVRLRG